MNMKNKPLVVLILCSILIVSLMACMSNLSNGSQDIQNSKIAYVVYEEGGPVVYVMAPDGSQKIRLVKGAAPCWSPDGVRIAFSARIDGNRDIYFMDTDGTNVMRLTTHPASDGGPSWSPDGSMIAFESNRSGSSQVWRTNVDKGNWGFNLTQLTQDTPHRRVNNFLSWSPNGLWIAFEADRDRDDPEIYLANAVDGSNQQRLNFTRALDEVPAWSPDSKQIIFSSDMHGEPQSGNYDIYIMNVDGSHQQRLTKTDGAASNPSMSPDGAKIVYDLRTDNEGGLDIFVMNRDGSDSMSLGKGSNPVWSPFLKSVSNK